jgi:hypothetical protein
MYAPIKQRLWSNFLEENDIVKGVDENVAGRASATPRGAVCQQCQGFLLLP